MQTLSYVSTRLHVGSAQMLLALGTHLALLCRHRDTWVGLALMHMLRKGQMDDGSGRGRHHSRTVYSLAASCPASPLQRLHITICHRTPMLPGEHHDARALH